MKGVIVGAFIIQVGIPEITRFFPAIPGKPDLFPAFRNIAIGILILLVLRFRPEGIIPEPKPRDERIEAAESRTSGVQAHA